MSVCGLWLSLERSADGFLALQFSLDLSRAGVYPGHPADSRISLLEFLVFAALALSGFASKALWWAGGGMVSPQPFVLKQVSSEYMGLEG